jgi:hypothetical protein
MFRADVALRLGGFALAACGSGGGFPDAPPPDQPGPTGTFSVSWSVIDQNSQPIACDRIAAQTMTVLTHNIAVEGGSTEPLGCSTGMGMSQGLTPGTYEMDFELAGTFGVLAMGAQQAGVEIVANTNVELAPVSFQVEALGGVSLQLASGKAGGNCGTIANGGAGINQVSITLNHNSDLTCEPVTLTISAGATQPGGMYTINCTTPVMRGCIESDQTITAMNVPSDSYTIRVRGFIGANVCWLNQDAIQVPPLQKVLMRTLNLAQQTQTPGC